MSETDLSGATAASDAASMTSAAGASDASDMTGVISMTIEDAVARIQPLDESALEAARARQRALLKPIGSLGELENIAIQFAGITGRIKNKIDRRVHFLFGADNGVYAEGVSGTPQYFTRTLMQFYAGRSRSKCGINALTEHANVELRLFDLGVKDLGELPGIDSSHKFMPDGTNNLARERAVPPEIVREAIELGINLAAQAKAQGCEIIGAGEVGMGNTTTATACIMAVLGADPEDFAFIGRGGGLTDKAFDKKCRVISRALKFHKPDRDDALEIISCVGGLDIAAMTGVFVGAAACRVPVVVDGVIAIAAALLSTLISPITRDFMFGSHVSTEPAYSRAADALKLRPMLNLGMRLGEGTGCPIAMQIIETALAVMNNMNTFEEASLESEYRGELKHAVKDK